MKCLICGREYVALGVHIRHTHKISPAEYKEEHGMLMATPLVDDWLSDSLRANQLSRLKDPEYKSELVGRCKANAAGSVGKPGVGMTRAGKESIARHDKERNKQYLVKQAVVVAAVLREKGTMLDVRKATGTGPVAGRKMAEIAGVSYTRESAKIERDKRNAATQRAKAMVRVAKVMPLLETTRSAAEMCRLAGISIKTYKNWLNRGLIPRHPNGSGPRPSKG